MSTATTVRVNGANAPGARKALLSSLAGTVVEWYEFFVYGTAAALVFGQLFFPSFDPLVGTLLSLSTFAVAFVARPIGAAIFGHLGDRLGRKKSLVITLTMMGSATVLIGFLPTYDQVGVWAPALLIFLRVVQGLSLGGEYSGAVLISVEHAGPKKRGLFGSIVNTGSPAGLILANLIFLPLVLLGNEEFLAWGWRIPFIASAVLVFIGLIIRAHVNESPAFEALRKKAVVTVSPVGEVFRHHWRKVILLSLAYIGAGTFFYTASVFSLSYAQHIGIARGDMLWVVIGGFAFLAVGMVFFGWLSDRVNRKAIFVVGAIFMVPAPFVWFWMTDTKSLIVMLLAMVLMFIPFSANYGVMPTFYAEIFPPAVRYSGMAIGYTLGTILGSATAPIVGTYLLGATGGWFAIAVFMGGASLISAIAGAFLKEDPTALVASGH